MSKAKSPEGVGKERVIRQFPDPRRNTAEALENPHPNQHSDADSIRRHFGIPKWDESAFDWSVLPNLLRHTWDASPGQTAGGTDLLATGKPGSGKSTQALGMAERLIELNDETVVWRGSPSRSEWLPLAPWTTLHLPRGVDVDVLLEPRDPRQQPVRLDVDDLERIVRDVRRYASPTELLGDRLDAGQFNVVFPDPRMRGCQELYEASHYRVDDLEFGADDPPKHWWFGFALSRIVDGPHHWTTWIADEIGDLVPQSASKDEFCTFQKVSLLKDLWVDARKHGLSIFCWGHSENDVHQLIRHKMRWRITMPGGANPTSKSEIVGFRSVPMETDLCSRMDIGEALLFTEQNFQTFKYPNFPLQTDHKLKIQFQN